MRARRTVVAVAVGWLWLAGTVQADPTIERAQEALKEQGFYYGEITGAKDTDTSAAIRRFQIRNGLKVTGELNAETLKSLGLSGRGSTPRATPPPPRVEPRPVEPEPAEPEPSEDTSDLRDDSAGLEMEQDDEVARGDMGDDAFEAGPRGAIGVFYGTPYEAAPPHVQQQVVADAQARLARSGYYRSGVDGVFGPGTEFALRAYQSRVGLMPSGRFDMETLTSLGLLPRQRPGYGPRRRIIRRPPRVILGPGGEPIYIPR